MIAGDGDHRCRDAVAAPKRRRPEGGVTPDLEPLVLIEAGRFAQQPGWHHDLADIVQQPGLGDHLQVGIAQTHRRPEQRETGRYADRMGVGRVVMRAQRIQDRA